MKRFPRTVVLMLALSLPPIEANAFFSWACVKNLFPWSRETAPNYRMEGEEIFVTYEGRETPLSELLPEDSIAKLREDPARLQYWETFVHLEGEGAIRRWSSGGGNSVAHAADAP